MYYEKYGHSCYCGDLTDDEEGKGFYAERIDYSILSGMKPHLPYPEPEEMPKYFDIDVLPEYGKGREKDFSDSL